MCLMRAVVPRSLTSKLYLGLLFVVLAGRQQTSAQPLIRVQPRNAAVLIGQGAQFEVTALNSANPAFQWRFEGKDLLNVTNSSITIANVAPGSLDKYDVVVSDGTGSVTSAPAQLMLARWTELVVFGRGMDIVRCGNSAWPQYLANWLGVPLRNYAEFAPTGFDPTPPSSVVSGEIDLYLGASPPTDKTLVALWMGANDLFIAQSPVEEAVAAQIELLRRLAAAGTRHFLIPTMMPPEVSAFWVESFLSLTSEVALQFDSLLTEQLKVLKLENEFTVYRPDTFSLFTAMRKDPKAYGFTAPLGGSDFLCNGVNFSAKVHRLAFEEFARSITPPVWMTSVSRMSQGDLLLNWSGGSPPFRVERTTDLLSGQWESVAEPTVLPSAKIKPASPDISHAW